MSLAFIKPHHAHSYINERLKEIRNGKPITPRTVRREINSIQHIFQVAKDQWADFENLTNPFRGIKIKGSVYRRKRKLQEGELAKLEQACKKCLGLNRFYVPLAIYLAIETGMRLQEIFNLIWQDMDVNKHQLKYEKARRIIRGSTGEARLCCHF